MSLAQAEAPADAPGRRSGQLSPLERSTLAFARFCNTSPLLKRCAHLVNLAVTYRLVRLLAGSRVHVIGVERFAGIQPTRGVLFAPNHRSFFDLYLAMAAIEPFVRRARRMYFPVRSKFWYDSVLGVGLNALMSSMSMYPPIFREPRKRGVTREGLDFLADELDKPGVIAGMHPEGTRSKGSDPYALLPAEQSFGRVVLRAKPQVVPVFVNGVGNSLARECLETLRGTAPPIVVVFGSPLALDALTELDPTRLRSQIEVGQHALAAIRVLAEEERLYRASLRPG